MKRSQRVGAICQILTESPGKIFSLNYFCEKFSAAKSSISEDISTAKEAVHAAGYGYIETIPGAAGGVKYMTDISPEKAKEVQGNAEIQARELRRVANEYCEDALRRTEEAVAEAYDEIKKSRARFRALAGGGAPAGRQPYDVEAE